MLENDDMAQSACPTVREGRYLHWKGGEYEVLATALDSENEQLTVVYRPVGDDQLWVRSASMFTELVPVPGKPEREPRFRFLG